MAHIGQVTSYEKAGIRGIAVGLSISLALWAVDLFENVVAIAPITLILALLVMLVAWIRDALR